LNNSKKTISIIGGGASALMFACCIDTKKYDVTLFEKNKTLGRKFLVAGDGGLNLTHSENSAQFANRYIPNDFILAALQQFSNHDFINWLKSIGVETFVGTSKRVFPKKGMKPIDVLSLIIDRIKRNNVNIKTEFIWKGFEENDLVFENENNNYPVKSDFTIFALGGSSWKITGSSGDWLRIFSEKGISVNPFYPSNCAYKINWKEVILKQISGKPLKNCVFTCHDKSIKGEAVLTEFGVEGSGIYPLSPQIRKQIIEDKKANICIDFKPDLSREDIIKRFTENSNLSIKDILEKKLNLSHVQFVLIQSITTKEDYLNSKTLSQLIKAFPLELIGFSDIDEAISTVGGIALNEVGATFEFNKLRHHYCIGEMLDFDAPTGGYLLQASFSMGHFVATKLNELNP
jgi:uncharacterized flavoprotein (TIGR03862 family)